MSDAPYQHKGAAQYKCTVPVSTCQADVLRALGRSDLPVKPSPSMSWISREELLEVLDDNNADRCRSQTQGDRDSWKELYRVLVTSLRHSSTQFQVLSLEALTLGLWGLGTAHATLTDDIAGELVGVADRDVIKEFIYFGEWARAFEAGKTVAELAAALHIQASDVMVYQAASQPMLPAHLVAVDHTHRQLLLVVRGTTQLADALTDLVAHSTTLAQGPVHSGMLDCAKAIIQLRLAALEIQLKQHPGFRIHCIGHSLGGGVAALAAYLLRNTPELRTKLSAAGCSGVMATGFGTPPVMTYELAEAVGGYVRTLVHNHDLVPRTCVASLAVLRLELEQQKEAVFASNATMSWLRDSGVIAGSKTLLAGAVTYAVANASATKVAGTITRSAGVQRFMAAGLQVGASLLANRVKALHIDAMGEPAGASTSLAAVAVSSSNTAEAASAAITTNANVRTVAAQAAAQSANHAGAAAVPASSRWGSFAVLQQAAAAATAAAATRFQQQQQQHLPAQNAAGDVATEQQQKQSVDSNVAAAAHLHSVQQQQQTEEMQAAGVMLHCPGELFYLKRTGEDAEAKYELIRKESSAAAATAAVTSDTSPSCFGRIIINRSMLRDHYLSHYITGLHKLELQLLQDM